MGGFLVFLAVFLVLFGGVHYYVWRRLARDTTAPGSVWRRVGAAAAVLLPLWSIAALFATRVEAPMWVKRLAEWPGYLWLPVLLFLTLTLLATEPVRWWLLRRSRSAARQTVGAASSSASTPGVGQAVGEEEEVGLVPVGGALIEGPGQDREIDHQREEQQAIQDYKSDSGKPASGTTLGDLLKEQMGSD
jgi:uncharacterized protein